MALSTDYAAPVNVNGFLCRNCTEVEQAKKNIDPAHPKSGPFGADADIDPTVPEGDVKKVEAAEEKARTRGENTASERGHAGDPTKGLAVNILV